MTNLARYLEGALSARYGASSFSHDLDFTGMIYVCMYVIPWQLEQLSRARPDGVANTTKGKPTHTNSHSPLELNPVPTFA
jgi:hypothetical protein